MAERKKRESMKFMFSKNFNRDQIPEDEHGSDEDTEDDGEDYFWEVVVPVYNWEVQFIMDLSEASKVSPQKILARYIAMGCTADSCEISGDYTELEKHFGLTKFEN